MAGCSVPPYFFLNATHLVSLSLSESLFCCPYLSKLKQCKSLLSSQERQGQRGREKSGNISRSDPLCRNNPAKYQAHKLQVKRTAAVNNLIYLLSHQGNKSAPLWIALAVRLLMWKIWKATIHLPSCLFPCCVKLNACRGKCNLAAGGCRTCFGARE